jgi:hypothetical protein
MIDNVRILELLKFEKNGEYFVLNNVCDNKVITNLNKILYPNLKLRKLDSVTIADTIKVKLSDMLSINFIYNGGNSEFTIDISNFDRIFTSILRDIRDSRIDEILEYRTI